MRLFLFLFFCCYSFACEDEFLGGYMSYEEAKRYVIEVLHPKNKKDFYEWLMGDERPIDFPRNLSLVYGDKWKGIDDFLSIGDVGFRETFDDRKDRLIKEGRPYEGFKSYFEPRVIGSSGNPVVRRSVVREKSVIEGVKREYMSFEDAKEYIRGFSFKTANQYRIWVRQESFGRRDLPLEPAKEYASEWVNWVDYLGVK